MQTGHGASALVVLLGFAAAACGSAQDGQRRPLEGFDAIEVGGGIDLDVRLARDFVVEVATTGDPAAIVTELRNRTLVIRRRGSLGRFFDWDGDRASVRVTLRELKSLSASGGSDVRTMGTFASDDFKVVASGGSDITIDVAAGALDATSSGGSDLRLRGTARSARVHASGGSDVDATELTADEADVQSSGGSDLMIAVRNRIAGNASGGSDIVYSGQPQTVDVDASGGSDVRRR
jgi:hypothetical protein